MNVVSDASPLINLSRIGRLALLPELYQQVTVPEAVWQEVVVDGAGQPGASEIETAHWIRRQQIVNTLLVRALGQELDPGEAEAIVLALEMEDSLLLMDERLGRAMAQHLGVRMIGLIGVLIEARHKGLISDLEAEFDTLRNLAGFRLSQALCDVILREFEDPNP